MTGASRRATAAFEVRDTRGDVVRRGEGEAVIGDEALGIGPLNVAFLDVDSVRSADYRIELDLWPGGMLVLTQLGRRFDTFTESLRRARNQARVAGLLAHGIAMPEVFSGALLDGSAPGPAELQVYDTHLTAVPEAGDPFQMPLGALSSVGTSADGVAVVIESDGARLTAGQLGRGRDAFFQAISLRMASLGRLLAGLTGQDCFADGRAVRRDGMTGFDRLLDRYSAADRREGAEVLLGLATGEPRIGFVQLLDPDAESLAAREALPDNWAAFVIVPVGAATVLEIIAGPAAATYVFSGDADPVCRDLQAIHFRRAPLALTGEQAELTPFNPWRLALRKLEPLRRLRACTTARLIHSDGWRDALIRALA